MLSFPQARRPGRSASVQPVVCLDSDDDDSAAAPGDFFEDRGGDPALRLRFADTYNNNNNNNSSSSSSLYGVDVGFDNIVHDTADLHVASIDYEESSVPSTPSTAATQSTLFTPPTAHSTPPLLPAASSTPSAALSASVQEAASKPHQTVWIGGIKVRFPFKPYRAQMQVMSKMISALKTSTNALLESPTGSGKTMALLCASLAWAEAYADGLPQAEGTLAAAAESSTAPSTLPSPPASMHTPVSRESSVESDISVELDESEPVAPDVLPSASSSQPPTIYYCSRTHKQIAQVIKELRQNAPYSPRMAVLGSRSQMCVNDNVLYGKPSSPGKQYRITKIDDFMRKKDSTRVENNDTFNMDELVQALNGTSDSQANTNGHGSIVYIDEKSDQASASAIEGRCADARACGKCDFYTRYNQKIRAKKNPYSYLPPIARQIHDIEDLVNDAKSNPDTGYCPYFLARGLVYGADIVFCPYNYVLDPFVRAEVDLKLDNAVVLIDEGHNAESVLCDALSMSIADSDLYGAVNLARSVHGNLMEEDPQAAGWYLKIANILSGIRSGILLLSGLPRDHLKFSGKDEILAMMKQLSLDSRQLRLLRHAVAIVEDHYMMIRKDANENTADAYRDDSGSSNLGGDIYEEYDDKRRRRMQTITTTCIRFLKRFCTLLEYILNGGHMTDFAFAMHEPTADSEPIFSEFSAEMKCLAAVLGKQYTQPSIFWSIHCLSPAVGFEPLSRATRSIVITSGTLSPLKTFELELGAPFPHTIEADHVIAPDRVMAACLEVGYNHRELNSRLQSASNPEYMDAIGRQLLDTARIVPHGVLVFFPTYTLMNSMRARWAETGLLARLTDTKHVMYEPRKAAELNEFLAEFQRRVHGHDESADSTWRSSADGTGRPTQNGCMMFGVLRGKVSEGIDFRNEQCRAVVIVGIPYANRVAPPVMLKIEYNDWRSKDLRHSKHSKHLKHLTGSDWYITSAFRAINQALGRCIRHIDDWGAIILLDSRFGLADSQGMLSKWVRSRVATYPVPSSMLLSLEAFVSTRVAADNATTAATTVAPPVALVRDNTDFDGYWLGPNAVPAASIKIEPVSVPVPVPAPVPVFASGSCRRVIKTEPATSSFDGFSDLEDFDHFDTDDVSLAGMSWPDDMSVDMAF